MDDGFTLLTSQDVGPLLASAVQHAGGQLIEWSLDHVDTNPEQSTTATYAAQVEWSFGRREELLGVSARVGELSGSDTNAEIFADGNREVAVWIYPADPDLPGLTRAAYPEQLADLFNSQRLLSRPVSAQQLSVTMIGYRPRRRAVVKVVVNDPFETFYIKVLRPQLYDDVLGKHLMLAQSRVPGPQVALATDDKLMVLRELPGRSLTRGLFDPGDPCSAEDLIGVLDAMPSTVSQLPRRAPWSDAVGHYASMVQAGLPDTKQDLDWAVHTITQGLSPIPLGDEPTHGDFHEGQLRVDQGRIVGILDVDTIGPGRRADDLACLIAHLSTIQRMNPQQKAKVEELLARWVPVFDERVDPVELRLRAAAVVISLATGPYRSQEPHWRETTWQMVRAAVALIRQVV